MPSFCTECVYTMVFRMFNFYAACFSCDNELMYLQEMPYIFLIS